MSRDLLTNLVAAGLDTGLAQKALEAGFNLTKLRSATKKDLEPHFYSGEVERIRDALQRAEIDPVVLQQLVEKCDWACCACWNIDERNPVIVHHIVEHAKRGDDAYENLVVLCLNHHGMAHSIWTICRHPLSPEFIKTRKMDFEKAIAEFKAGKRVAPGREGGTGPDSTTDVDALGAIAGFLSRPAISRPFAGEGNMTEFLTAMADVIRTLNTGIMKTREGDEIGRTKPSRQFANLRWREKMALLSDQFDGIASRVQMAIRQGELNINPDTGWYNFVNPTLPGEIDAARHSAIALLNGVLGEAGIGRVRGPLS
jgi:hypothetical protein